MIGAPDAAAYLRDGFLVVRGLFSTRELGPLSEALAPDHTLGGSGFEMLDADGAAMDAIAWVEPSETLLGLLPSAERTVRVAEGLLGEEVYHWHSKLTVKRPHSPGRVEWHQDYGAWYFEGCLAPALVTVGLAIEPCTRENGCLELVRGSHHLGRLEHEYLDEAQHRVAPERLEQILARLETVAVTLEVGDAVFFHCNTLHGSWGNTSDTFRTLLLSTYNAAGNSPTEPAQRRRAYRPMRLVPDAAFREQRYETVVDGHRFLRPGADQMRGFGAKSFET